MNKTRNVCLLIIGITFMIISIASAEWFGSKKPRNIASGKKISQCNSEEAYLHVSWVRGAFGGESRTFNVSIPCDDGIPPIDSLDTVDFQFDAIQDALIFLSHIKNHKLYREDGPNKYSAEYTVK